MPRAERHRSGSARRTYLVDDLLKTPHNEPASGFQTIKEQFLILVTCRDEKEQVDLLRRFKDEGWECKALVA